VEILKKNSKNIWTLNPCFFFLNTDAHNGGFVELCLSLQYDKHTPSVATYMCSLIQLTALK